MDGPRVEGPFRWNVSRKARCFLLKRCQVLKEHVIVSNRDITRDEFAGADDLTAKRAKDNLLA